MEQLSSHDTHEAVAAKATVGEVVGEEGADLFEEPSPDIEPEELPGEEVPEAEAGRPPDPPERESREVADAGDEHEIEVEGEGAPVRAAKGGTLKAEAKSLAHLCTHRYRNPCCEACVRAEMKHYRAERSAPKREFEVMGIPDYLRLLGHAQSN